MYVFYAQKNISMCFWTIPSSYSFPARKLYFHCHVIAADLCVHASTTLVLCSVR
jgi:hypothetical protein